MRRFLRTILIALITLVSLANVFLGWLTASPGLVLVGALGFGVAALRIAAWQRAARRKSRQERGVSRGEAPPRRRMPADPSDPAALVEQMLDQGRFALLLRPQIAAGLDDPQVHRTADAMEQKMALVPDGEVALGPIDDVLEGGRVQEDALAQTGGRIVRVEHFFLDRYPVTNRDFYEFVVGGGYEQMALWEVTIWPAVLDFVDRTGQPGPRFWEHGCYPQGKADHPVVGVSWYEAAAYARWVGKRLPSDAEWVKAGSWPVTLSESSRMQRRYPWGNAMDRSRANLWGTGPGDTVPVDRYAEGVSVGGVFQLVGNVWEWTGGSFRGFEQPEGELILTTPMKSIRGGAFDTYFDSQATCQFQSGENPLARKHNIGFRCAVGVCDLAMDRIFGRPPEEAGLPEPVAEEVAP